MKSTLRNFTWAIVSVTCLIALSGCGTESTSAPTTLTGVVNDEVGVPVADAVVTAVTSSSSALTVSSAKAAEVTTVTGVDGSYIIMVPNGASQVVVSKPGFTGQSGEPGPRGGMNFDLAGQRPPMERMDADGDGLVTQAEWKGPADAFLKIDADSSGSLTTAELEAAHKDRKDNHPRRPRMDTDGDGLISRTEWQGPAAHFDEIDTDESGTLSQTEMQTAMQRRGPPPPRP